jgi:hypothetical protein
LGVTGSYTIRTFFQGIVISTILFSISSFPVWQGIFASQTENANEAVGNTPFYGAWIYFRKYALQTENVNQSSITNDTAQQAANRSLILQESSDGTRVETGEIGNMQRPELVAEELKALSPIQIAEYPMHELSSDDIVGTLNLLSDTEIQKVLGNTKPDNLQIIFTKIPGELHELILNRLDPSTKSYVLNSIGAGPTPP